MEKIDSFKINHKLLNPGIYVSRIDRFGKTVLTTFDIRIMKPNVDRVMDIAGMHTIEHIGATYFRNHPVIKDKVVYFGPMGCQTGFYLIMQGDYPLYRKAHKELIGIIMDMFKYIIDFNRNDKIPGATPEECGNYKSQDIDLARTYASNIYVLYQDFMLLEYEYPTGDPEIDKDAHLRQEMFINRVHDRENIREARKNGFDISEKSMRKSDTSVIGRWENDDVCQLTPDPVEDLLTDIDRKTVDSSLPLF